MTKRLKVHLENYNDLIELAGAMSAIGASNTDLIICVVKDINALINYSIWGSETLEESEAVEYLLDNIVHNGGSVDNNALNDIRFITGMIACEILAGIMLFDRFYEYIMDVDTLKFYDVGLDRTMASMRVELEHMHELDGREPDASRLIAGIFQLYKCGGQEGMELRDEVRSIVGGYSGSVI
jgi:hypothetical protein